MKVRNVLEPEARLRRPLPEVVSVSDLTFRAYGHVFQTKEKVKRSVELPVDVAGVRHATAEGYASIAVSVPKLKITVTGVAPAWLRNALVSLSRSSRE